jgi:hypothetical protein
MAMAMAISISIKDHKTKEHPDDGSFDGLTSWSMLAGD